MRVRGTVNNQRVVSVILKTLFSDIKGCFGVAGNR